MFRVNKFYFKNSTDNDRFILINCNILGDFSGDNILSTGSVFNQPTANEVHSYRIAILSANKDSVLIGNDAGKNTK